MKNEIHSKINKCKLEKSTILNLSGLELEIVPDEIASLHHIQALDLSHNKIKFIPKFLVEIRDLKVLDLKNNLIRDIDPLRGLKNINILNLSINEIEILPLDIEFWQFDYLEDLRLSNNKITLIPQSISKCKYLRQLDISNNKISIIPESLSKLQVLHVLNLSYNQIKIIPKWAFDYKRITQVSIDQYRHYSILYLKGNPVQSPPFEILGKDTESIRNYFVEKERQGTEKLYEAKIILLGEPGSGKTTLSRKFNNIHSPLPKDEETTRGIDIIPWEFAMPTANLFRANIWDFGGQQIYHSTHRYFLTKRSLYILLSDNRMENLDIKYWLEMTKLFAEDSPVYILQNEKEGRKKELDVKYEKSHFQNLKDIYSLDLNNEDQSSLEKFIEKIKSKLLELPHIGIDLPKKWIEIRNVLEKMGEATPYISQEEYFMICRKHDLDNDDSALHLSGYFHDLGVFLHFKNNPILKHWVILQPTWATDAVYVILDNPESKGGIVNRHYIENIWNYHPRFNKMYDALLALMTEFQICYATTEAKTRYVIPQLLSINRAEFDWIPVNELKISFKYEFLPKGLIHQIIVRLHKYIKSQSHERYVWSTGILLEYLGSLGEIYEDYRSNMIHVKVCGERLDNKKFLHVIENEIENIHDLYPSTLEVDKHIPCICEGCRESISPYFFPYKRINDAFRRGKSILQCQISFDDIKIEELIGEYVFSEGYAFSVAMVRQLISAGRTNEGIEMLQKNKYDSDELQDRITLVANRWSRLKQDRIRGITTINDSRIEENAITSAVLDLIADLR